MNYIIGCGVGFTFMFVAARDSGSFTCSRRCCPLYRKCGTAAGLDGTITASTPLGRNLGLLG